MNFKDTSTDDLEKELKNFASNLTENEETRKMYIGIELDNRVRIIQDMLCEFNDLSKVDYELIDAILMKLRIKIGSY